MITHYPKDWIARASAHYCHAVEKHPHFCDKLLEYDGNVAYWEKILACERKWMAELESRGIMSAKHLLDCEMAEAFVEIAKGDKERAVDEIWDAVAVLMRMADMVERGGRSSTARP